MRTVYHTWLRLQADRCGRGSHRDGRARTALVMERLNFRKVSELYSTLVIGTMTAFITAALAAARVAMLMAVLVAVTTAMGVAVAAAAAVVSAL